MVAQEQGEEPARIPLLRLMVVGDGGRPEVLPNIFL